METNNFRVITVLVFFLFMTVVPHMVTAADIPNDIGPYVIIEPKAVIPNARINEWVFFSDGTGNYMGIKLTSNNKTSRTTFEKIDCIIIGKGEDDLEFGEITSFNVTKNKLYIRIGGELYDVNVTNYLDLKRALEYIIKAEQPRLPKGFERAPEFANLTLSQLERIFSGANVQSTQTTFIVTGFPAVGIVSLFKLNPQGNVIYWENYLKKWEDVKKTDDFLVKLIEEFNKYYCLGSQPIGNNYFWDGGLLPGNIGAVMLNSIDDKEWIILTFVYRR